MTGVRVPKGKLIEQEQSIMFAEPSPEYGPADVVRIQLEALAHNNEPYPDAGIHTAFNFASPHNRRGTGPINRFVQLIKDTPYASMLEYSSAEYGQLRIADDRAFQTVVLTMRDHEVVGFLFVLSRYTEGWMTDAVHAIDLRV